MRALSRAVAVALMLIVLPSCDDGTTTPTQPGGGAGPLGPAQVTVTVQFSQATASALQGFIEGEFQDRSAQGTMFFGNVEGVSAGDLDGYLLIGTIQGDRVLEADVNLNPSISLPPGANTPVSFDQAFTIDDPTLFRRTNNPGMNWQLQARVSDGAGGTQVVDANGTIGSGLTRLSGDPCAGDSNTLCLGEDGRFQVEIDWRDFDNSTGSATVIETFGTQGGSFFFFNPNNTDLLLDVLDNCASNDHFWVFATSTTNVEFTVTVTDTETSTTKSYFNPLGDASQAITDTQAFATCPGPVP